MPASEVPQRTRRTQKQLAYALVTVGATVVANSLRMTVRLDAAVVAAAFANGLLLGGLALVTAIITLVLHGHHHLADTALAPGMLAAAIAGRWVLTLINDRVSVQRWLTTRIGALVGMSFVAGGFERLLLKQHDVPSLGQWSSSALATLAGLCLGALLVWRPKRSPGSVAVFASAAVAFGTAIMLLFTVSFWSRQDERLLHITSDASVVGVLSSLTEDMNVISAKVATSTEVTFDEVTFSELIQSVVFGHETIHAAQLVHINSDQSVVVLSELSAMGEEFDRSLANWTQGQGPAFARVIASEVLTYTGFTWLPLPTGGEQPYLVYAAPVAVNGSFSGSRNLLVTTISLPVLLNNAAAPTIVATSQADILLYARAPEGLTALWSTSANWDSTAPNPGSVSNLSAEPADTTASQAVSTFSLNATEFDLIVRRGVDFGSPLGFRRIVLAAESLGGLLLLSLLIANGDRTARRERERVRREALLGAALQGSLGWTAIIDENDCVMMANSNQHGGATGSRIADLTLWSNDSEASSKICRLLSGARGGEPGSMQHVWSDPTDASHAIRIFQVEVRPLSDPSMVYVQCVDVTEHRDRAMRTAQSERMEAIGVLAGGLAHDFNNLLFITLGYLQMLQRQQLISNDKQANMYVTRAIEAVDRGAVVAKSLLSFARSQPLTAVPLNLREFLENLKPLVEQGLGSAHSLTTTTAAGESLDVVVDPGRLSNSLLNIVFNARDAMDGPGRLEIRVAHATASRDDDAEPEDMVAISVTDTGRGVPPEVLARAFEPFFTTKKVGSGTGLGLSTVYSFAQQSGGWAAMESTEGVGTTVTIFLPSVRGSVAPVTSAQATLHVATKALVVDDEPALADLVAGWLESFGMVVRVANSPQTALQVADEFKPQLLISDANLADPVDGLELARVLVQRDPSLLVVFMTGFSDRIKALQRAGVATLAKPFSSDDLRAILVTHLGERLAHQSQPEGPL
ncbi:unannotated protein [freshwater metagenome]|uniref:Unannotated protein n=2 Tax=freshwater metagenome TaxID=449393 RepID=A0A6J7KR17_9ZZZZ|nr:response regulator [Actinomycetota bacterium]